MFLPNFLLLAALAGAQPPTAVSTESALPAYLALLPNINDFGRFADGGSDANWYIGFNNAWIVKLPPAPLGEFPRAFVGAKVGRAKTRPNPDKPWLRELIAGKIYMAVSQTPGFSSGQSFFLTDTEEIPVEADPQAYVPGVASSQWFWAEVPPALISFTQPNYLVIWSPTEYFLSASSSPILAASEASDSAPSDEVAAWNSHSIMGVPPRSAAEALETPIKNIRPALAIKLVPANENEVSVSEFSLVRDGKKGIVEFSAGGENIAEAWVESSRDELDWARISRISRRQPFIFTIHPEKLPPSGWFLRGAARDVSGNTGVSSAVMIPYAIQP